jgi:hypothetical protein
MSKLFLQKSIRKDGITRSVACIALSLFLVLGMWGGVPAVSVAAPIYIEMTGNLNVYNGVTGTGTAVRTTTISGHDYIAAVFGPAAWASSNAYNFNNT